MRTRTTRGGVTPYASNLEATSSSSPTGSLESRPSKPADFVQSAFNVSPTPSLATWNTGSSEGSAATHVAPLPTELSGAGTPPPSPPKPSKEKFGPVNDLQITAVNLVEEGVEISYIQIPKDIRKNGLVWAHSVLVPTGSDYDDEIEAFQEALTSLLADALDDEDRAEAVDPPSEEDEPDSDEEDEEDQ